MNDRKWTELVSSWNETSKWSKPEDYNFLKGVIKHGYGRWTEIVQDQELNLHQAALLATGRNQQASTEPANPNNNAPQLIALGKSTTTTLYKPDKIISRFLRKRLQLLESALFIEFQFDSPTEFPEFAKDSDSEMEDDTITFTEVSENTNNSQDDKSDSDNEILAIVDTNEPDSADIEMSDTVKPLSNSTHTAEPVGDTPVSSETTSSDSVAEQPTTVEPVCDLAGEFAKQYENVKLTPELLELLGSRYKSNSKDELFADYSARIEFLSSFGEVYNLAHHLREQFVQYSKSLVTTDVLEEAHNHHFQG